MSDYFKKFPIIDYEGSFVRNILARAAIDESRSLNYYYDYTLKEHDTRMDIVADKYYDDATCDWMIWMANKVLNTYEDLGLSNEDFDAYILKKYGSQANAQSQIVFWRNAYKHDDSVLSTAAFSVLPDAVKKYYDFSIDYYGNISGYVRKKEDWITATNKIISLEWTSSVAPGNKVTQGAAHGFAKSSNATHVLLQHVSGTFTTNTQVHSVTTIYEAIPNTEAYLWEPVDALTWEQEQNEAKRQIKIIDNRYVSQVEQDLEDLLNE